tara:strand:+ start:347 stop:751 length:405 start_codon:yes stop_codon:yes gene_type:complete
MEKYSEALVAMEKYSEALVIKTLKKRRDFMLVNKGIKISTRGFIMLARKRLNDKETELNSVRVGYTCSKKIGNAVVRNRAKRRLRALIRTSLPDIGIKSYDYVLIGKYDKTNKLPFETLENDLRTCISKLQQTI